MRRQVQPTTKHRGLHRPGPVDEGEMRVFIQPLGLTLRVGLPPTAQGGTIHWMIEHPEHGRIVEFWPATGTWWSKQKNERGHIETGEELVCLCRLLLLDRNSPTQQPSSFSKAIQPQVMPEPGFTVDGREQGATRADVIDQLKWISEISLNLADALTDQRLGHATQLRRLFACVREARTSLVKQAECLTLHS